MVSKLKDKLKKHLIEVIVFASLLAISLTAVICLSFSKNVSSIAVIKHHNETLLKVDLSKEGEERHIEVNGDHGIVTIAFKKDYVCVENSGCPSQYCVHEGWIKAGDKPIVCAYNGISITFMEDSGGTAILG